MCWNTSMHLIFIPILDLFLNIILKIMLNNPKNNGNFEEYDKNNKFGKHNHSNVSIIMMKFKMQIIFEL